MEIIHQNLNGPGHVHDHSPDERHSSHGLPSIAVRADRRTLAKTRWRGAAEDGREFGFDLTHPLWNGAVLFESDAARYVIEQSPEPLLRVTVIDPANAARVGWMIGNLHFPAQVRDGAIYVEADLAVRQMLEREGISFEETEAIFQPLVAGAGHAHSGHSHRH